MKTKFILLFLLFGFSHVLSNAQPSNKNEIVLKYEGNIDFYPFEYLDDNGNPTGFTIHLLKEIEKNNGVKFEIELKKWSAVSNDLQYGKNFDLTSLYYSAKRDTIVDFCYPLLITYDELFIRKSENNINSINDLIGKEVLVEKDGFIDEYIRTNLPKLKVIHVSTESEAQKLINEGKHDAAIVNYYSGIANLNRFNLTNIYSKSIPWVPREYGFAVKPGDSVLLKMVNDAILKIKQEGTYDKIYKKWFIYDEDSIRYQNYFVWTGLGLLFIGFAAALIFSWNRTLNREVKKKTEELTKAKTEAENLSRLKSEFISQISHEIRTPVNVVISGVDFLKEQLRDEKDEFTLSVADSIISATKRLIRTIDLIINFAEIRTGTYSFSRKKIDIITDVLNPLLREYKNEAMLKKVDLLLNLKTEKRIIDADEFSVKQIFSNLIDNAIKYTDDGFITVSVEETENKIKIGVEDTGKGISDDYMPRLFHAFSQEEQGYTRSYDGTGLGLPLVYQYCKLNNASLKIDKAKEKGTVFTVVFN